MMEETEIAGQIMLPIGGNILLVDYVNWGNRAWLVPVWLEGPDGQIRRPLRAIAPRFAPGFTPPPGPDVLNIFQNIPLPPAMLDQGFVPTDLAHVIEIVENPAFFIRIGNN